MNQDLDYDPDITGPLMFWTIIAGNIILSVLQKFGYL